MFRGRSPRPPKFILVLAYWISPPYQICVYATGGYCPYCPPPSGPVVTVLYCRPRETSECNPSEPTVHPSTSYPTPYNSNLKRGHDPPPPIQMGEHKPAHQYLLKYDVKVRIQTADLCTSVSAINTYKFLSFHRCVPNLLVYGEYKGRCLKINSQSGIKLPQT